ncbi:putative Deoxyribodipyrimidine photolyase [Streptomyces misionensis JCM 4497]
MRGGGAGGRRGGAHGGRAQRLRHPPGGPARAGAGGRRAPAGRARRGDRGRAARRGDPGHLRPLRGLHAVLPALGAGPSSRRPVRPAPGARAGPGDGRTAARPRGRHRCLAGPAAGRRERGPQAADRLLARGPRRLRRHPRRPGGRRHLPALRASALRHPVPGGTGPPGPPPRRPGRRGAGTAARLARLPPPGPRRPTRRRARRLPRQGRPLAHGAHRTGRHRGVAAGPYRLSGDRRGDAAAAPRGLDAQPGPAADRRFPDQDTLRGLADRRRPLPVLAGRRRHRQQPAQLAVDGRDRHGHPPQPGPQPRPPGQAVRPRGRLCAPLGARTRRRRRPRRPRAVEAAGRGPGRAGLPRPGGRPGRGPGPLPPGPRPVGSPASRGALTRGPRPGGGPPRRPARRRGR